MVSHLHFICTFLVAFLIQPISSKQSYDVTECNATSVTTSASYLCTTSTKPCQAFTVYRTQEKYPTLSSISSLFNSNRTKLLTLNNLTELTSRNLPINRELLIPTYCTCSNNFSHSLLQYNSSSLDTYSTIACETFEGLSKEKMLEVQNPYVEDRTPTNSMVNVPIRCACPDGLDKSNGTNYLVTYPVVEGDDLPAIAWKFNVSEEMIWYVNSLYSLGPNPTIFPQTTLLIPTKEIPALVTFFAPSLNPSPGSTTAIISSAVPKGRNPRLNIAYIVIGVVVFTSIVLLIVSFLFIRSTRNRGQQNSESLSPRSFQLSNLSLDLLDDVSKLKQPLFNYSFDELKTATGDFSEASKISKSIYRGIVHGSGMVIKQVNSAEAHRVIEILTTINHINIVKLQGCCHMNQPYLVFELAANGSLRNCLSDPLLARQLTWVRRMEIAFDITVGLHYIHCCTKPCYVHRNLNSRVILITEDWRAKISGFGMAKPLPQNNNEKDDSETNKWKDTIMVGRRGYLAPEYLYHGFASPKVDVFALGIVLLELISGREAVGSGCMLKDSVGFLVGGLEGSSSCLEKLRGFMDPCLEGNYQLGDALCLALLAKSCLDEDHLRRPTMNGVLKALSRMLQGSGTFCARMLSTFTCVIPESDLKSLG